MFLCVSISHNLIPSLATEASSKPLGEYNTSTIKSVCSSSVAIFSFVSTSHSMTVPLKVPVASSEPLGEKATELSESVCPSNVAIFSSVSIFHNLTLRSRVTEARCEPSGENKKYRHSTSNIAIFSFVSTSHNIILSDPPEASTEPSGENKAKDPSRESIRYGEMPLALKVTNSRSAIDTATAFVVSLPRVSLFDARPLASVVTYTVVDWSPRFPSPAVTMNLTWTPCTGLLDLSLTSTTKGSSSSEPNIPCWSSPETLVSLNVDSNTFQHFTVPSDDPEARRVPSGENDRDITAFVCPLNVAIFSFVVISHSLTAPSYDPEASREPSGENDNDGL